MNDASLVLASQSSGRAALLHAAGIAFTAAPAHIDEEALTASLVASGQRPRGIADALAEAKAVKVSSRLPGALVLGADQILALDNDSLLAKPADPAAARAQLRRLSGQRHRLFSAVVAARDGTPVWRAVGEARLWVRGLSDAFIADYVAAHWDRIRWTVGCYEIEGAGVQLFDRVEGDPWTIVGMPMLPLLAWLRSTAVIPA